MRPISDSSSDILAKVWFWKNGDVLLLERERGGKFNAIVRGQRSVRNDIPVAIFVVFLLPDRDA